MKSTAEEILDSIIGIKTKSDAFKCEIIKAMEAYADAVIEERMKGDMVRICSKWELHLYDHEEDTGSIQAMLLVIDEYLKSQQK